MNQVLSYFFLMLMLLRIIHVDDLAVWSIKYFAIKHNLPFIQKGLDLNTMFEFYCNNYLPLRNHYRALDLLFIE